MPFTQSVTDCRDFFAELFLKKNGSVFLLKLKISEQQFELTFVCFYNSGFFQFAYLRRHGAPFHAEIIGESLSVIRNGEYFALVLF